MNAKAGDSPERLTRIMFVDDDPSILDAAKTAIESYGYQVVTAESGEDCLERLGEADLVFLDIKMPDMDGIETLKQIKQRDASIPVIMITAYATVDSAIEAMKEGAFDYIRKPFDMDELEGSILAAIEEIKFERLKQVGRESGDYIEKFRKLADEAHGIYIGTDVERVKDMDVETISLLADWEPRDLPAVQEDVDAALADDVVIALADVAYLLDKHPVGQVRDFLRWLYRMASLHKGRLILSTDFSGVDDKMADDIREVVADIRLSLFSDSISNYLRRRVIQALSDGDTYSFTTIAQLLDIKDNPKLSFHLKKLKDDGVIKQDEDKRYFLSQMGLDIAEVLEGIRERRVSDQTDFLWMPQE
ncbi:MAG: response regulator [Thermoplasmatota archaeon]